MRRTTLLLIGVAALLGCAARADELTLETAPPVVVRTVPEAGADDVDATTTEIRVTFSKEMLNESWSFVKIDPASFPEKAGEPKYDGDKRTCVLPVKLQPGKTYAVWLNSSKFQNFKDAGKQPAVPYLLVFRTRG